MRQREIMKLKTTAELGVLLEGIGALIGLCTVVSLFFVKNIGAALLILLVPAVYGVLAYFVCVKFKNALMVNVIDYNGVRNEHAGNPLCEFEWNEIGDFGVAEVRHGLFKGRYVYMSRIFVDNSIRRNIVMNYDPRICIVFPCTEETCFALREASGEKIDIS